jgi:hypothetical protein
LFSITLLLGTAFLFKNNTFDKIVIRILIVIFLIQLMSMIRFFETDYDRYFSVGLLYTRFLLPYFILKLIGKDFFIKFEKLSFRMILIGIPIFLFLQVYPNLSNLFRQFDLFTGMEQKNSGGWNIFFYVHNGWATDRFCGYAWEPGVLAMMICISWIVYILNYGTKLSFNIFVYASGIILTYSTTGYLVLGVFVLFYAFNKGLFFFAITISMMLVMIPVVWNQPFMKDKIIKYYELDQAVQDKGGYEKSSSYKAGRFGIIKVAYYEVKKWPLGYGSIDKGRIKNNNGEVLAGANGIANIFIYWGIFGGIFVFYSIYQFVFRRPIHLELRGKILLVFAIILVFSSNPTSNNPILITVVLFPFIFKNQLKPINESKIFD